MKIDLRLAAGGAYGAVSARRSASGRLEILFYPNAGEGARATLTTVGYWLDFTDFR